MRQRRSTTHQFASRIAALRMLHEFFDKCLQVGRKKTLGVPCKHPPSADSGIAVDNWNGAHALVSETYGRGQDANAVAGTCQFNDGIVRAALKQHVRLDVCCLTCRIEPLARREPPTQQQERFGRQLSDLEQSAAMPRVPICNYGNDVDWIE